jgi:hypothetical protein
MFGNSDGQRATKHAGTIGLSELAGEGRFNCRTANDHVVTPKSFIQAARIAERVPVRLRHPCRIL